MNDLITGSICLTTLIEQAKAGHSAFTKSAENGKVYANIAVWINEEVDKYGNHASLSLNSSKEKREQEGRVYFGNGKRREAKPVTSSDIDTGWESNIPVRETKATEPQAQNTPPVDDIPF